MEHFINIGDDTIHPEDRVMFIRILLDETQEYMRIKNKDVDDVTRTESHALWDIARERLDIDLGIKSQRVLHMVFNGPKFRE